MSRTARGRSRTARSASIVVPTKDGTYDQCGDIQQGGDNFLDLQTITFLCQDADADGFADVPACTVWANSATTKNDETSCQDASDTTAETTAKCTCEHVHVNLVVRKHGTITVTKVLSPATDSGKFNLQIDGQTNRCREQWLDGRGGRRRRPAAAGDRGVTQRGRDRGHFDEPGRLRTVDLVQQRPEP